MNAYLDEFWRKDGRVRLQQLLQVHVQVLKDHEYVRPADDYVVELHYRVVFQFFQD